MMSEEEDKKMDELSLDSITSEKISKVKQTKFEDDANYNCEKPRFKIEWRQLSYFQKSDSFLDRFVNRFMKSFGKEQQINSKNQSQQNHLNDQLSIYSDSTSFYSSESSQQQQQQQHQTNSLSCENSFSNHGQKQILNSLDGCFKSGELSAILGPSGAGKSTFLSTLFGSKQDGAYGQTKLTWFINSDDEAKKMSKHPLRTAFLPQHDHLLHHLTVYETLIFASKIKNATKLSINKVVEKKGDISGDNNNINFHRQNVKRVAKMLKLIDCLDTRCGKLSGGQYKRVSIAQELLSEPDVIILDEPTSGLDAMTCLTTILTLKSIVKKHPMSIILTIHQPDLDVFNLFDHVYVIAQGGLAIYEGPPNELVNTLKQVNLTMPCLTYNPARFIIENAFLVPETDNEAFMANMRNVSKNDSNYSTICESENLDDQILSDSSSSSSSAEEEDDDDDDKDDLKSKSSYLKRSFLSITEAISGKEMAGARKIKKKDKKPLLNIGIQTLDGKLITSKQLSRNQNNNTIDNSFIEERLSILKKLNQIQKSRYYSNDETTYNINSGNNNEDYDDSFYKSKTKFNNSSDRGPSPLSDFSNNNHVQSLEDVDDKNNSNRNNVKREKHDKSSAKSDYSSAAWSVRKHNINDDNGSSERSNSPHGSSDSSKRIGGKSISLTQLSSLANRKAIRNNDKRDAKINCSLEMIKTSCDKTQRASKKLEDSSSGHGMDDVAEEFVVDFDTIDGQTTSSMTMTSRSSNQNQNQTHHQLISSRPTTRKKIKLKRQFDKRLSPKHSCSKNNDYPIWYHSFVLTHRTWLSIVRDPIFFGIQAIMHTTIPILLSLIFGSIQEEGCPRLGNFDLVEFAYSDSDNMIQGTVKSIRQSIGNIGIVFFEIFVLSFSINCITALVFPFDMYVLLKEYRNSWYSIRSYFIGRTLADLPVPVVLHSIGMSILYYLTNQPHSLWRFGCLLLLVISGSLIAQSIGLTIGAILMKSSQSAVLAAAGIVAPFFALSGFIVRAHTLPFLAQIGARASYLYHLLNGFIILRYGFDRCPCKEEDFESNEAHQIPNNLHTLASIWIGTYSNEYGNNNDSLLTNNNNSSTGLIISNRTNVDPNIDVVEKMMTAFKMTNSYGHQINNCSDVLPYAMLDFNLRDNDIYSCFMVLMLMIIIFRLITFVTIYLKVRSNS